MLKKIFGFGALLLMTAAANSQEIQTRLTVNTQKIATTVDKKIFNTLQTALSNFINNRKWTNDAFNPNEKIQVNFLLTLDQAMSNNVYKGSLTIQAARPIHSTTYDSPLINYIDDNVVFRYQEYQPIEFNENRVQGNDPMAANLPAIFAYYVNLILGFDYGSFAPRGGDPYFQKAWNIVNNAPESADISGWKSFESLRNRYWLAENLNNNRFVLIHDILYAYYRTGLDQFISNEDEARKGVLTSINFLNSMNTENPNSMLLQFFFQGKSSELVRVFRRAPADMKSRAKDLLSKLDITNASTYKEL